jgi:hypothetical protein
MSDERIDDLPPFEVTPGEQQILDCYEQLRATLAEHGDELPPFVQRNAVKALAALWQVANGEGTQPGQVYDVEG